MPFSPNLILQLMLDLFKNAFASMGNVLFNSYDIFLKISPLPDVLDFLLVCVFLVWCAWKFLKMMLGN